MDYCLRQGRDYCVRYIIFGIQNVFYLLHKKILHYFSLKDNSLTDLRIKVYELLSPTKDSALIKGKK